MAQITADFETGVNGNTIATGDTGSATAWTSVSIGASTTATYDNTHAAFGTLSGHLVTAGNHVYLEWSTPFGTQTDHYGRFYIWLNAAPSGFVNLINAYFGTATVAAIIRINADRKFTFVDNPINVSSSSAVACATGQWSRIEYHIVHHGSTGSIEMKLFNTASSSTPDDTLTWSNRNTLTGGADRIFFGTRFDSGNTHNFWLDNMIAAAVSYPGPVAAGGSLLYSPRPTIYSL